LGMRVLGFDPYVAEPPSFVHPTALADLWPQADAISLHCPLTPESRHLINARTLARMKQGVMLINTGRGALIDTRAVVAALKSGKIGYLGLDVYEEEADLFFEDLSSRVIQDDVFTRLLTFPNVIITGHQAFLTENGLRAIAETTLGNLTAFERGEPLANQVTLESLRSR
ncbi:MAG: 2-hydroxyacid dehydrogenase, partial [Verrucomicrobiae bacterium]|nr:2-hydroxyacid dehydrogenase [Verrucomicrobiae bacterium]